MAALTKDRNTPLRDGKIFHLPVLAATEIFAGSLVVLNAAGWAIPGAVATTLKAAGRAEEHVDNSAGANGDLTVAVRSDVFRWANSAGADEITQAEVGDTCYVVDDQTVARTDGTTTRSAAGKVVDVDDQGVWVATGLLFT